jgi:hypothetical protein
MALIAVVAALGTAVAGDDASGPVRYELDLSAPFTIDRLSAADRDWARTLAKRLKYKGRIVLFVRTSLPVAVDGQTVDGEVYRAVEEPEFFYVARGDAMLRIGSRFPFSPGSGGFSAHAPKSRRFVACFNFERDGVPFLSSSPVRMGKVTWGGDETKRF